MYYFRASHPNSIIIIEKKRIKNSYKINKAKGRELLNILELLLFFPDTHTSNN